MTAEEAVRLIRGRKGTAVKLLIFPKGEEATKEITLIRDTIIVPILETEEKTGGIFLIKLTVSPETPLMNLETLCENSFIPATAK